ncbi:hypothetical protein [Desulfolithobacter sp.]
MKSIVYNVKDLRLMAALEKLDGYRAQNNLPQEMTKAAVELAQGYERIIDGLKAKVTAIKADKRLSEQGKRDDIAQATEQALQAIERLTGSQEDFDRIIQDLEARRVNRVTQARQENTPEDPLLAHLEEQEIRRYINELRKEEKQALLERITQAKESTDPDRKPITDQEREYRDPAAALLLEACQDYGPDKEPLIRALTNLPWPMLAVDPETAAQAQETLKATLAPDETAHIQHARARQKFINQLHTAATQAILSVR